MKERKVLTRLEDPIDFLQCLGKVGRIARPIGLDNGLEMACNTVGSFVREAFKESDFILSGIPINLQASLGW